MKTRFPSSISLQSLGCCTAALGAAVEDYPVTISGVTVPASRIFSDEFLAARTKETVQRLASGLLSGSAGVPPVLNDDGSITVKGLAVVPPGGAKVAEFEKVWTTPVSIPAAIPVSNTPASAATRNPAPWWTAVAKANTTNNALVGLENLIVQNKAAVTATGAVVGPGKTPSSGGAAVYVTLQPAGAVDIALYRAAGGVLFTQTSPTTLAPVSGGATTATTAASGDSWLTTLVNTTLQTAAKASATNFLNTILPPPAPPSLAMPTTGTALPPPPSTSGGVIPANNLGLGFTMPIPPLAPAAPSAPSYGGSIPPLTSMPTVPTSGNIATPTVLPSTLPQAFTPPALPVLPGIPQTSATGAGTTTTGYDILTGAALPGRIDVPAAPAVPVAPAGPDWGKIALAGGVVLALGAAVFAAARSGRGATRTVYRRAPSRRRYRYA